MVGVEPSYQLVARELRDQILRGEFADDARLPTESELAARYGVSRQTVRRAFHDLVASRLVRREQGRGSFAQPGGDGYIRQVGTIDDLMGLSDDTAMRVVRPLRRRVDPTGAGRLRAPSDVVYEMQLVRLDADVPFCVTTVTLPPDVYGLLADVEELSRAGAVSDLTVIGLLDARLADPITAAQQSITVGVASMTDAEQLGCPPGQACLQIDRLYLDSANAGVELAVSLFLPHHYSYRIRLQRSGL